MERLTFDGLFCDIAKCDETPGGTFCETGSCTQRKVWERLKEYEDTGLDPEALQSTVDIDYVRIMELLKADKDGRLFIIPWAVGDVIYEADPAHGVVRHTFAEEPAWMMHSYAVDDAGNEWYDGWGSSDETPCYKTREEAEAALKGEGHAEAE